MQQRANGEKFTQDLSATRVTTERTDATLQVLRRQPVSIRPCWTVASSRAAEKAARQPSAQQARLKAVHLIRTLYEKAKRDQPAAPKLGAAPSSMSEGSAM